MEWTMDRLRKAYIHDPVALTEEDILEWFKLLGAGWIHNGDPKKPHAKLASGKCSNGFFLCKKVLAYGNLREIIARNILEGLAGLVDNNQIDGVFGAPYSSILLAGDVGRLLGVKTYVPEKDPADPAGKKMLFKGDDMAPENALLLQVEELITTSGSAEAAKQAMIAGHPYPIRFVPAVGTFVYRPEKIIRWLPDRRVVAPVIEREVAIWDPAECPLCKAGSVPLAPKTHWAELTA